MEDFGFKLQNIRKRYWFKKFVKVLFVILTIFISIFTIIKIVKVFTKNTINQIENIPLIKSKVKILKILPENKGGLVVDNLDVKVYNILDDKYKENIKPKVSKTNQVIDTKNDQILNDQELLLQKIDEINDTDNDNSLINNETDVVETNNKILAKDEFKKNVKVQNSNIKVGNKEKRLKTDINDLKQLGNNSLIRNIKDNKDVKPGIKVQLLALANRDSLIKYWETLKLTYSNLFNDKDYYIEKVSLNRTNTIYRLQVGMFEDNNQAQDFCKEYIRLANKNKVDCIIVKN